MILAPDQRALYLEALRPPEGYAFDCGIGTTFSLDLYTLLVAPVSLALLEVEDATEAIQNPLLLLEGIRRYAKDLTIFCQAGRIAVPRKHISLLNLLESSVVEVEAPLGGVFHPKVWLLRYVAEHDDLDARPLYRLLNLTRNLTFDNSWDLMLRLEGYLATHRQLAYAGNHPLGDFVEQLPDMARHRVSQRTLEQIGQLQNEVRRVDFKTPEPFWEHLAFYPAGIHGHRAYRFNDRCDRALVVSPFLSDRMLQRITEKGSEHVLISRPDSIDKLNHKTRDSFARIYTLHDMGRQEEASDPSDEVGQPVPGARPEPLGLHAKLFIVEAGWDATWLIGSANATWPAFYRHNVEFMVELKGRRSKIGIDEILDQEEENSFRSMLRPYTVEETVDDGDGDAQAERLANNVRDWLVGLDMELKVEKSKEAAFNLVLRTAQASHKPPSGTFSVTCRPISLQPEQSRPLLICASPVCGADGDSDDTPGLVASIRWEVSQLALTAFMGFEVEAHAEDHSHNLRFSLNLPIAGLPEDREDHILCSILSNPERFLRYLRVLLAERDDPALWAEAFRGRSAGRWGRSTQPDEVPLLRDLMRALSRSPDKIDHIAQVVERLRSTSEGRRVLPRDFQVLWEAVMEARRELQ